MTSSRFRILPVGLTAALIASCAHSQSAATAAQPIPPRAEALAQLLAGRVSGVDVATVAGGGISVRISGPRSFFMSSEPLYVVDDVVVQPGPNGMLAWLSPPDIASIRVLKYETDTAIYGVRGANGVVIIKTKGAH
jgi:TonB-dependent SusC/RagA subfamily outer membrane receptor